MKDFARFDRTEERVNLPTVSQLRRVGNTLKSSRNWAETMVWGFVQKEDDKKFRAGDILKAVGWELCSC